MASTYSNKENLYNNENKTGVPNLSVEPLKMKRSKKAGGYNLRKSLAWDQAFLTEEGVLNDSELSLISGTLGDQDSISALDQQGRNSLPGNHDTGCNSADTGTTEESLVLSGFSNKRNATSSSVIKRDSLNSSNKGSPGHGLKTPASQGEVCSSLMGSASQKRLLNTGTKKIFTRSSQIPKLPVTRKNSCVPSTTPFQCTSGGSSLKSSEITQSGKSLSSKLPPKMKHVSSSAKLLEPVPKSVKPSADIGNYLTNSTLPLHSLMSHKAEYTIKVSKSSKINSSQSPGGANTVESSDGKISTIALSRVENAGLNKKIVQVQGAKPSGLRMPSPSLRFFSETKAPVSSTSSQVNSTRPNLLKSNIPTLKNPTVADQIYDYKTTHLLCRAPNVDTMVKGGMCSQKTNNCPTSSNVAAKVCAKEIQVKCNQQTVVPQIQQVYKQCKDQVATSLKAEEKSTKDKKSNSSQVEFKEAISKATILFQDITTVDRSMLDDFLKCCPEVKLMEASETSEAQLQGFGDVKFDSSIKNIDVIPDFQTSSNSRHKNLMLISDSDLSSNILNDDGLDQTCNQRNLKVSLDDLNSLADGSSVKLDYDYSGVQVCTDDFEAVQNITGNCNANFSMALESKYDHLDVERGDEIFDSKLSTMIHSESIEEQDKANENPDKQKRKYTNSKYKDDKHVCDDSFVVVEHSSHWFSTLPKPSNEYPGEFVNLCKPDQGEEQSQSSRHGIADNCASAHGATIAYHQSTEITKDVYIEEDKQQILDNNLFAKEMLLQDRSPNDKVNSLTLQTTHLEFQLSEPKSKDPKALSCIDNKHELPSRDALMSANFEEVIKSDEAERNISPRESKMRISQHYDGLSDSSTCNTKDLDDEHRFTKQKTGDQKLTRPPPSNVLPFSDEWLAAIESAGEEILTLKTGAVKHSPPDKSVPEPSPWSPVKRKNNQVIGPFDCTKYTNI